MFSCDFTGLLSGQFAVNISTLFQFKRVSHLDPRSEVNQRDGATSIEVADSLTYVAPVNTLKSQSRSLERVGLIESDSPIA
jgi:hypothetical protein